MVHKLVLVAAVGLATSAVCIGTAAAIGGVDLRDGGDGFSLFDGRPREALAGLGEVRVPGLSDLFVALMSGEAPIARGEAA